MKKVQVWFAIIEVKAINENLSLDEAVGAYVNVAYLAYNENDFIERIQKTFSEKDFTVVEIDDIENQANLSIDNPDEAEKLELLRDIEVEGYDYSWGVYHTFDEEEDSVESEL